MKTGVMIIKKSIKINHIKSLKIFFHDLSLFFDIS